MLKECTNTQLHWKHTIALVMYLQLAIRVHGALGALPVEAITLDSHQSMHTCMYMQPFPYLNLLNATIAKRLDQLTSAVQY